MLRRAWTCVGRLDRACGLDALPGRLAVVDVLGESVLVTVARTARCTRTPTSAGTAARRSCRSTRPAARAAPCDAWALRCPYHSWTYDLDGSLLLRAAHRGRRRLRRRPASRCTRSASTRGAASLWSTCTPTAQPSLRRRARSGARTGCGATRSTALVVGRRLDYDVARQLEGARRELQRVLPLRPGAPRAGRGWCRPSAGGGAGPRLGRTASRTARAPGRSPCPAPPTAAPFPDLDEDERCGTRASWSTRTCCCRCRPTTSRRSCCEPLGGGPHPGRLRPAVRARRGGQAEASTRPTPPSFWDLVNRQDWAICESVQRGMSSRAYRRAGTPRWRTRRLDIRRWLLPRLASRAVSERERRRRIEYAVVGLGALGSATAWQLARARRERRRARAVRARARARRLARHARGSSGTATTRPTTSR